MREGLTLYQRDGRTEILAHRHQQSRLGRHSLQVVGKSGPDTAVPMAKPCLVEGLMLRKSAVMVVWRQLKVMMRIHQCLAVELDGLRSKMELDQSLN